MSVICFSHAEVTTVSKLGFWLEFDAEELYLPFAEFPRFEHASIAQLTGVVCASSGLLYWPGLDLDLALEHIRNPFAGDGDGDGGRGSGRASRKCQRIRKHQSSPPKR